MHYYKTCMSCMSCVCVAVCGSACHTETCTSCVCVCVAVCGSACHTETCTSCVCVCCCLWFSMSHCCNAARPCVVQCSQSRFPKDHVIADSETERLQRVAQCILLAALSLIFVCARATPLCSPIPSLCTVLMGSAFLMVVECF